MKILLVFALSLALASAYFDRMYHGSVAVLEMTTYTADCEGAGTNSDFTISPGFVNENGVLIWHVKMPIVRGNTDNNSRRNTTVTRIQALDKDTFMDIEVACVKYAKWDDKRYRECFNPNFISIQEYVFFTHLYGRWKPGYFNTKLHIQGPRRYSVEEKKITTGDCWSDWVKGNSGNYYLCERRTEIPWDLPKGSSDPYVGKKYVC